MSLDQNNPSYEVKTPAGARYAIVWSRFNRDVVSKLLEGARKGLADHGVDLSEVAVFEVPGAWELAHAANRLAHSGQFAAVVTLGAIIRGGTPHFDFVANGATNGLMQVMTTTGVPIVFGVLTTDDEAQAYDRAGGAHGNKGWDAARTAVEMAMLDDQLKNNG